MRIIVVFATVFYACCCFAALNIFLFDSIRQSSDIIIYRVERSLLNDTVRADEILNQCRNFTDKIVKVLNYRPTEEELQAILSQCRLILQENSKLFVSKDENASTRSQLFRNNRIQEHNFNMTIESSQEGNGKNTEENKISSRTSERRGNVGTSSSEPLFRKYKDLKKMSTNRIFHSTTESSGFWNFVFGSKGTEEIEYTSEGPNNHGNLKIVPTSMNPKPTSKSSGLWNLLFWNDGSSDSSSSVQVTNQYVGNSAEKPTEKQENQKTELNVIPNLTNKSWSLWNYVFGVSDFSKSSHEKPSSKNLERSPTKESSLYFGNSTDLHYLTTSNPSIWNLVMPGTKWCGSGDIAENDDDLGYFEDVDRCCRTHDKCDDIMLPGEFKYNLTNTSPFTVLNCKCDDELYDCLSQINSVASNTVGNTFFNIFGRMCYMLDYPRVCKKNSLLGCLEYVIDKTAKKSYQWKPAKKYIKKPFTISG